MEAMLLSNGYILELCDVTVSFGGVRALDRVTVRFPTARVSSIIGANGAGKTTAFNVAGGLVRPDSGRVIYRGRVLNGRPPYAIARLGLGRLFQAPRVFGKMTSLENVAVGHNGGLVESPLTGAMWPVLCGDRERQNLDRARYYLEFVGLADECDRPAEYLSYGQQKRLCIARLLNSGADCLLLDEPTAGVQRGAVLGILDLVKQIVEAGKTVVMIEHNLEAVQRISDLVFVLECGHFTTPAESARVMADIGERRPDE